MGKYNKEFKNLKIFKILQKLSGFEYLILYNI